MADRKISDLTALTAPAAGDYLPIVDISEVAAASKNKRITIEELFRGVPLGTAAAPSIAIEGDENTGIYSPGADQLAISTGGTGRLFVDASGNVGVGTSSPTSYSGAGFGPTIESRGGSGGIFKSANSGDTVQGLFYAGTNIVTLNVVTNHPLAINTNNTERLRITSAGLLGLGTSAPATPSLPARYTTVGKALCFGQASNSAGNTTAIVPVYDGTSNDIAYTTRGSFSFCVNNTGTAHTEAVFINSSGRVGIGTTSPSQLLEVSSNSTSIQYPLALTNTATSGGTLAVGQLFRVYTGSAVANCGSIFATGSTWTFSNYAANSINLVGNESGGVGIRAANAPIVFYNGNATADSSSERARIDSSGRLLVGTSSQSGGSLLQVNDNRIRIATAKTPASATDTGVAGEICWDANYVYVCTATNTWKRTAISTW